MPYPSPQRVQEITPELEETLVRLIRAHKSMTKHLDRITKALDELAERIDPIASHGPPLESAKKLHERGRYCLGESHTETLRAVGDVLRYLPQFPGAL